MLLSLVFLSMAGCFIWYGIVDRGPPMRIISAAVSSADPKTGLLEVTFTAKRSRYCHGQMFGFLHDKYSFGLDPVELPPDDFRGSAPTDGIVTWTIPVDVKDYFWNDPDGFTYRAEWRYRCNSLQGPFFPKPVVSSPDVVVPHK
jgi:hypothetical protein